MNGHQTEKQSGDSNKPGEVGDYKFGCAVSLISLVGMFVSLCGGALTYGEEPVWPFVVAVVAFWICAAGIVAGLGVHLGDPDYRAKERIDRKRNEQRRQTLESQWHEREFGTLHLKMVCPHCQKQGTVRTKKVLRKKGLSGAKATGALLTGGLSVLATGLSRKEDETQAHCDECGSTWHF